MLEMSYTELISRDEMIAARDKAGGNLHDAMMIDEKAEINWNQLKPNYSSRK
jgi:hypothetical protein